MVTQPIISKSELAAALLSASQHLDRREPDMALTVLAPLLLADSSPEAFLLAGAAHRMLGALSPAEAMFRHSLKLNPRQAGLYVSLGQLLRRQSRFLEAVAIFREALRLEEANTNAHMGLANALRQSGDLAGAEQAYRDLLQLKPESIEARIAYGLLLNELGRPDEAEEILRPALALAADSKSKSVIEHALAVSAVRLNRLEDALAHLDIARQLDPASHRIDQDRAAVLQRLYRDGDALLVLKDLVRRDPGNLDAHYALNQILYRSGREEEFLSSYDQAAGRQPGRADIPLSKARFLLAAERFSEAGAIFSTVFKADEANKSAATGLVTALRHIGEYDAAIAAGKTALRRFPDDIELCAAIAAALLGKGEPLEAQWYVLRALSNDPHSQMLLALQGLIWRACGDPREETLHDYKNQIRVFDLPPPAGFSSIQAFNSELNAMLDSLHPPAREYVDQSLRRGTQTVGSIFGAGYDLAERLKVRIAEAVEAYIAAMPEDATHPFYGRRTTGFRFAGSWSSRLRDQGFHTSHIHAEGWISSCYYVALPDAVADTEKRQGWIEFGRPPFEINLPNPVRRAVQPRAGQLVLFPSYMLHGTVPFHSTQDRTTIAFDVVPRSSDTGVLP